MKLISLTLKNFKGLKSFMFEPNGASATIFGDNATGKTTVMDAMLWLLFGKNSENAAEFGIKTRVNGEEMSHAEHEVCGVFELDGGRIITLRKVYHEEWTTPRGKAVPVLKGNTTDYFIGEGNNPVGVPAKASEYKRYIESLANEDIFKLLTNPMYFNTKLTWQKRRDIILQVCGDVSDQDVVNASKELVGLKDLINNQSVEQIKKETAYKAKRIKEELERIPQRIDELQMMLLSEPAIFAANSFAAGGRIELQREIDQVSQELAEVKAADPKGSIRNEISTTEMQINNIVAAATVEQSKEKARLGEFMAAETAVVNELHRTLSDLKLQGTQLEVKIKECGNKREQLLQQFKEVSSINFIAPEIKTICPTCGQNIPGDEVSAAQEKLEKDAETFNVKRATRIAEIQAAGRINNEEKDAYEKTLADINASIARKEIDLAEAKGRENLFAVQIREVKLILPPEHETLSRKRDALTSKLEATDSEVRQSLVVELEQKRNALQISMDEGLRKIAALEANEKNKKRIQELLDNEKTLNSQFEDLERIVFLCDSFVRVKVDMLTAKINSRFSIARFKLFEENISNDGIAECCETMVDGVPFTDLNNAMRINVGLDIIRTLAHHYNFAAPIFIDNAESVTSFIDMQDQQMISLVVSGADKSLRVVQ